MSTIKKTVEANVIAASSKLYGLCRTPPVALVAGMVKYRTLREAMRPFSRWPWLGVKKPLHWWIDRQCELSLCLSEDLARASDPFPRWQWLGRLKEVDGGFRVCEGGEEDVR